MVSKQICLAIIISYSCQLRGCSEWDIGKKKSREILNAVKIVNLSAHKPSYNEKPVLKDKKLMRNKTVFLSYFIQ